MAGKIRVTVSLPRGGVRVVEVERGTRVADVLRGLGLVLEEVVAAVDGEIVPEDERIYRDSRIEVYSVVSGG